MRFVATPLPVLYVCAGCREYGYAAPRVAQALDQRGLAQAIWLGSAQAGVSGRYPVFSLDACEKGCARQWARERCGSVERAFILEPQERDDPQKATARIAAELSPR
jgi:uncharacterized metal-binding protein